MKTLRFLKRENKAGILFAATAGSNGANNDTAANYRSNYTTLQGISIETANGEVSHYLMLETCNDRGSPLHKRRRLHNTR